MQAYLATHISPHLLRTKDGGLLAKDVVIARSGPMDYAPQELQIPERGPRVTVWREPEEITNRRFLASCEGAVVTDAHPTRFVDPGNYSYLARGHMQNARVGPLDDGGNATAVADLFIKDGGLAEKVESGAVRDVSIGYRLDLLKDHRGRYVQKNLEVNHVAVVERGRGETTRILDAAPAPVARTLADMAADFLGKPIGSVKAFDSESEEIMPENNWKCGCGNFNHAAADDCARCGAAYHEPVEQIAKDEALRYLKQIKPQVTRRGTDEQKRAWNALYTRIRDDQPPVLALRDVRGIAFDSDKPETEDQLLRRRRRQLRPGSKMMTAEDAQRRWREIEAEDFVETCASYLGQDINEVAARRRERKVERALADASTPAADLVATCDAYLGAADIHEVERKLRKRN